jgi:hypothetical protein
MAQRWMQAKLILMARHGRTASGCNRATGGVWDDVKVGLKDETVPGKVGDNKKAAKVCRKAERPTAWGASKKAKRALTAAPVWNIK